MLTSTVYSMMMRLSSPLLFYENLKDPGILEGSLNEKGRRYCPFLAVWSLNVKALSLQSSRGILLRACSTSSFLETFLRDKTSAELTSPSILPLS
jgi:hypothetical protein